MAFATLTKKVIMDIYGDINKTDPKVAKDLIEKAETYRARLNALAGLKPELYKKEKEEFIKTVKENYLNTAARNASKEKGKAGATA